MANAISKRLLFPPLVPQSIPAFDAKGKPVFKLFFKKSPANFAGGLNGNTQGDNFEHVQIAINRLDNNRNAINTQIDYNNSGYIMATLAKNPDGTIQSLDDFSTNPEPNKIYKVYGRDPKTPYCVIIPTLNRSFFDLNILYKLQLRLGANSLVNPAKVTLKDVKEMEKNLYLSEWSSITTFKPIDPPIFGLTGFIESNKDNPSVGEANTISTSTFTYVGYYENNVITEIQNQTRSYILDVNYRLEEGQEILTSYRFVLKTGNNEKVLDDSGEKKVSEHERKNIQHTFSYTTKDKESYVIEFHVKTLNGYEDYKTYILKPNYKRMNASNSLIKITSEEYRARMKLEVDAKQVVFVPSIDSEYPAEVGELDVTNVRDVYSNVNGVKNGDPMMNIAADELAKIKTSHVLFKGTSTTNKSFLLVNQNDLDRWVCEIKASGWIPYKDRELALQNPYVVIQNDVEGDPRKPYYTVLKVICYKKNMNLFGLSTTIVTDPITGNQKYATDSSVQEQIIIEAIKESYRKDRDSNPKLLARQSVKNIQMLKDKSVITPFYRWFGGSKIEKITVPKEIGKVGDNWTLDGNGRPVDAPFKDKTYYKNKPYKVYKSPSDSTKTNLNHLAELEFYIYLANIDGSLAFHITETEYLPEIKDRNFYITKNSAMMNFFNDRDKYVREKGGN